MNTHFLLFIKKDFDIFKNNILVYILLGVLAIAIMAIPTQGSGYIGAIILVSSMVSFYCHLVIRLVTLEIKNKTHIYIMSLPFTAQKLRWYKVASAISIAFIVWTLVYFSLTMVLINLENYPAVSLAFYSVIFGMYIIAFLALLAVAIASENEGWTIFTLVIGNIITTLAFNLIPPEISIQHGSKLGTLGDKGVLWPAEAIHILLIESFVAALLFLLIIFIVRRKKEFF